MRAYHFIPLLAVPLLPGCTKALAKAPAEAERTVELTVYKQDFAMVRETRPVELEDGRTKLQVRAVSNSLDPNSVMIGFPDKSQVVSTTFDLGVSDQSNMLKRLSGQEVDLMLPSQDGTPGKTIHGVLEPSADGGFLLRTDDKLYVNPPGTIIASSQTDVATLPQLSAEVQSASGGQKDMTLTYLSRGLSWNADYIARLSDKDEVELELWATVTNQTGIRFKDAKISFMAGEPNRAVVEYKGRMAAKSAPGGAGAYSEIQADSSLPSTAMPTAVGELYAYKAPAPATVGIDQMNRIPMMEPVTVPIKRDYSVNLPYLSSWGYQSYGRSGDRITAQLAIKFMNDKQSHLGIPLPAGAARVYGSESEGAGYVGAASIPDTPKNTPVHLTLSKVFDVYVEPKVVSTRKIDKRTTRRTVEVTLHNEKKSDVELRLVQPIYQNWKPVSESHKPVKLNANTLQWTIPVPAGGEAKLRFEVDLKN